MIMRKEKIAATILSLIMAGVLIAGTLTGCSENSSNSNLGRESSPQETDVQSSSDTLTDTADDNKETAQAAEGVEDNSTADAASSETMEGTNAESLETPEEGSEITETGSEIADSNEADAEESTQYSDGEIDFSQYEIYLDLLKDMNYDDLKIIVWNSQKGGQAILSDGDSYEMQKDDNLYLYYPQENLNVTSNDIVNIFASYGTDCGFYIYAAGENLEATFNAIAPDSTEYEITVYITKDFKG